MASANENTKTATPHLVDDFESAFQNCISLLTSQEHFNVQDSDETRGGVETSVQRFLESARQMETFFLNKRLILSVAKPENVLNEDMIELKAELERKEALLEKHYEKLPKWQNLLRASTLPPSSSQSSPYAGSQQQGSGSSSGGILHQTMAQSSSAGPPSSSGPYMSAGGPPTQAAQQMMSQAQPPQQPPGMTPGQYPGPPAGHPGQYMPPPAYPQQGPLAFLERM